MLKILTVCGMGLGSSFAIEMVLEELLKDMKIPADLNHTSVTDAAGLKADIIVTSKNFASTLEGMSTETPIIALQNLTDKVEIRSKLEPILQQLGHYQ